MDVNHPTTDMSETDLRDEDEIRAKLSEIRQYDDYADTTIDGMQLRHEHQALVSFSERYNSRLASASADAKGWIDALRWMLGSEVVEEP